MTSALDTVLASATPFALPLNTSFRGVTEREGVLIQGPNGWGEFSPFPEYGVDVTARWLAFAVEAAFGEFPQPVRASVPVNAIVPACDPRTAGELTYRAVVTDGCRTIKVKVAEPGQNLDDDIVRLDAVRAVLNAQGFADAKIRIDVNAAWDVPTATSAIKELDTVAGGLEYVEQPCVSIEELAALRRLVSVPIAGDEIIRNAGSPFVATAHEAVDVIVMKPTHMGGVALAFEVAQAAGVPVVVSGSMDSAVGLGSAVALAGCLPTLPYACGLGTGALLAADVVSTPLRPHNGTLPVHRVEPDTDALANAEARVSDQRRVWWMERISNAWAAGASDLVSSVVNVQ